MLYGWVFTPGFTVEIAFGGLAIVSKHIQLDKQHKMIAKAVLKTLFDENLSLDLLPFKFLWYKCQAVGVCMCSSTIGRIPFPLL